MAELCAMREEFLREDRGWKDTPPDARGCRSPSGDVGAGDLAPRRVGRLPRSDGQREARVIFRHYPRLGIAIDCKDKSGTNSLWLREIKHEVIRNPQGADPRENRDPQTQARGSRGSRLKIAPNPGSEQLAVAALRHAVPAI